MEKMFFKRNQPTINAAAADHVVLEQGEEEEGEEEEMRALELICGEKRWRRGFPLNKNQKALHYKTLLGFQVL